MGFNTALSYTVGNWAIASLTTDTISTGKTLTVSDLDYANDFVVVEDEPTEGKLANITSTALGTMEQIRYAKSGVANVYSNSSIGASNQMPVKTGLRTLVEVNSTIQATNSVSGEEYLVPIRAWTCVQIPSASFIESSVVEYALGRCFGALFNTDSVTIDREVEVARGALIPD